MSDILRDFTKNKVHIGNIQAWWNPDFAYYIYTKLNGRYIINLNKTIKEVRKAHKLINNFRKEGKKLLFISTNRYNRGCFTNAATYENDFYITHKWIDGILSGSLDSFIHYVDTYEYFINLYNVYDFPHIGRSKEYLDYKRYIEGIREYSPENVGAAVFIGSKADRRAIIECKKLGFTTIGLLNTHDSLTDIDIMIPCNTYSNKSIDTVLKYMIKGE